MKYFTDFLNMFSGMFARAPFNPEVDKNWDEKNSTGFTSEIFVNNSFLADRIKQIDAELQMLKNNLPDLNEK
ncbi:MAG: hypothetical protein Q8J84_08810 [Flavobacteriaceae bacterium]|nr:hypothetical protein [Flavobacteriaceae bacterium]